MSHSLRWNYKVCFPIWLTRWTQDCLVVHSKLKSVLSWAKKFSAIITIKIFLNYVKICLLYTLYFKTIFFSFSIFLIHTRWVRRNVLNCRNVFVALFWKICPCHWLKVALLWHIFKNKIVDLQTVSNFFRKALVALAIAACISLILNESYN